MEQAKELMDTGCVKEAATLLSDVYEKATFNSEEGAELSLLMNELAQMQLGAGQALEAQALFERALSIRSAIELSRPEDVSIDTGANAAPVRASSDFL
eukprot:gene4886-5968_t